MKEAKQKQKASTSRMRAKELTSIETGLRGLADYLEHHLSLSREDTARLGRRLSTFDLRLHQCKIEAGRLLDKAVEIGVFQDQGRLRRLIGSQRFKDNPEWGYRSAFERTCLNWIPKQTDGFDFEWKRKQVGQVRAYILGMRYLANCVAKSIENVGERRNS